ncbi:MAG TPA: magnesium/cobalt transporter CorA [Methylophilus sp.]|nr:magnesium/cobalt transporter CorA [Methylophilus sp.]HQQ33789.1 magnesium/cobalt transporter CorA [Methylophilus sp.]
MQKNLRKKSRKTMSRKNRLQKVGLPPGSLVYTGESKSQLPVITMFDYDAGKVHEQTLSLDQVHILSIPKSGVRWVNVYGVHDVELIKKIGAAFHLHPLVMEDVVNTSNRPKDDVFAHQLFILAQFFNYDSSEMNVTQNQVSIVLGKHYVLTFQEHQSGAFEPVRKQLRAEGSHIRNQGADYLAYALLDSIVDRYFLVLDQLSDDCERMEDVLLSSPTTQTLNQIYHLKGECMELRRSVWPLREVINHLVRNENQFFSESTVFYLRDVYDHTVHFIESLEAIRDMLASMLDIYLSTLSNRVNMEVRALTVVAMLFMPATLIAGIFGMNTQWLPWHGNKNGFWYVIALMVAIALVMGLIFWRRQWLNKSSISED